MIEEVAMSKRIKDWNGLGFAIQAYGKRASNVVNWANELCSKREKMHVRLTKGAYWDGEIKFSQAGGHDLRLERILFLHPNRHLLSA